MQRQIRCPDTFEITKVGHIYSGASRILQLINNIFFAETEMRTHRLSHRNSLRTHS